MKDQLETLVAEMYGSGILYSEAVREFKKRFIMNVLQRSKGNQCKAARELGMHRNTLSRTLAGLKISAKEYWRPKDKKPPQSVRWCIWCESEICSVPTHQKDLTVIHNSDKAEGLKA